MDYKILVTRYRIKLVWTARRLAGILCVILIAFAAISATSNGRHFQYVTHRAGGNLMLLPGMPGISPALY